MAPDDHVGIIVAEDNDAVRMMMRIVLSEHGFTVHEAGDGRDAHDLFQRMRGTIRLIVTDLTLPGMTGNELAIQVLAEDPSIRILFVSGSSDQPIRLQHIPDESWSFLRKPFAPQSLLDGVLELLDRR